MANSAHAASHSTTHHTAGVGAYLAVFAALIVLTFATVGVAMLPLGEPWHTLLGLGIATTKAMLVILFFMHVAAATPLTRLFVASGFVFLAILVLFVLSDYLTRTWMTGTQPL